MPASEAALLVLLGDATERHTLPAEGSILIGSSRRCDVVVDHPSVAAEHVRLHLDGGVRIEDLGTAVGTTVRGVRLEPKGSTTVGNSDLVAIGEVVLLLRGERVTPTTRQFWGQEHFRLRLAEECARSPPARAGSGRSTRR